MSEAETASSSSDPTEISDTTTTVTDKNDDEFIEPDKKRRKLDCSRKDSRNDKLEHRLGGILCCAVCLDLPRAAIYQVFNQLILTFSPPCVLVRFASDRPTVFGRSSGHVLCPRPWPFPY